MDFKELQKLVYKSYVDNGFCGTWEEASNILKKSHKPELHKLIDLAECGLITTEVSETLEEIRNDDKEKIAKELAGCIIRIMNFATRLNIDLEPFIVSEELRNRNRGNHHGRKII
jgi:NTP pyrophosphatase (non-canonical NTP hydrolase)